MNYESKEDLKKLLATAERIEQLLLQLLARK